MIQLSFQPAFDVVHTAYRTLRLLKIYRLRREVTVDVARICDFYLLFPFRLGEITLRKDDIWIRQTAKSYRDAAPYGVQPDAKTLFDRMSPIQYAAFENLALLKLIDRDRYDARLICPTDNPLPDSLAARVATANEKEADLLTAIAALVTEYPESGPDSIKARTSLLEYRYDAAV